MVEPKIIAFGFWLQGLMAAESLEVEDWKDDYPYPSAQSDDQTYNYYRVEVSESPRFGELIYAGHALINLAHTTTKCPDPKLPGLYGAMDPWMKGYHESYAFRSKKGKEQVLAAYREFIPKYAANLGIEL